MQNALSTHASGALLPSALFLEGEGKPRTTTITTNYITHTRTIVSAFAFQV